MQTHRMPSLLSRQATASRGRWLTGCVLSVVLALFLGCLSIATAAPAPGGSIIENQAEASYFSNRTGVLETALSNTTRLQVSQVEAVTLEPDLSRSLTAGESVTLPHRLTNVGNTLTNYTLDYGNQSGDDYDAESLNLIRDLNGDGIANPGEPSLAPGSILSLMPGEVMDLVLTATVPVSASNGQMGRLEVSAVSDSGLASDAVTDELLVENGDPVMALTKSASSTQANPDETVKFRLAGTNSGGASAQPIDVVISGVANRYLIVRDALPANTTFDRFTQAAGAVPLLHVRGEPLHHYVRTAPPRVEDVDAVAFGYPALAPGQRVQGEFQVSIHRNAAYRLDNEGEVFFEDRDGATTRLPSNPVTVALPANPGELNYFSDGSFADTTGYGSASEPLFVSLDSGACNTDANLAERYPLSLTASLSGDVESRFEVVETGPNTGIFRISEVPTRSWPAFAAIPESGVVDVGINDTVVARTDCSGHALEARILIDPSGVVFDSQTNAPVAGAVVTLVGLAGDGSPFIPTVLGPDGMPVSNVVTTGADGLFRFPLVEPGDYRLQVEPPNGYAFASTVAIGALPAGRNVSAPGSYGGRFSVSLQSGPVFIDLPVDPGPLAGLMIKKVASRTTASIGETVLYSVTVANDTGVDLSGLTVVDTLPAGFAYLSGTARLGGGRVGDPDGSPGGKLRFQIDELGADELIKLVYRTQVRVGAQRGDGVNRAQAFGERATSNVATAKVRIVEDVFRDEAFILGKIYADCNGNRMQDAGELGVPGVRIFLEDGTFVISDGEGKYSFAGISPRTHVLKVDPITLPPGAQLQILDNRNMGDPKSRFVDLKKGELYRGDFAIGPCDETVDQAVKARRGQDLFLGGEAFIELETELPITPRAAVPDPRSRPASGLLQSDGRVVESRPQIHPDRSAVARPARLPPKPVRAAPTINLESLLPELDEQPGFVDLEDGATLPTQQVSVRVKGTAGAKFRLTVNGVEVPDERVGQKAVMATNRTQAWEYVAVKLQPGENRLEMAQLDPFGNARGGETITVIAPDRLGRIVASGPSSGSPADGRTPATVLVDLMDDRGIPVTARIPVTLESSIGAWEVEDFDPSQPGVQTFVEGGQGIFNLLPPQMPGDARVRISSGVIETEIQVAFLPDLRPLLAVGLVEGRLDLSRLNRDELAPATKQDSFEREIKSFSFGQDNAFRGGARTAFFVKGKVKDQYLLTLSYDSDKDDRDRLFRDIQPELFYPVYGDAAIKGFDAQSTSKLFARIDKDRSFAQYGDFVTGTGSELRRLGNYSRSLTGFLGHYEQERFEINAFAAEEDSRQVVVEFQARGISGPYELGRGDIVPNSEKVEILTRDREQPSVVIETEPRQRFRDYEMNDLSGTLLFRRAVPSVDPRLNPIFIRVTFEVHDGGDDYWIYAVDGRWAVNNWFQVAGSLVQDTHPTEGIDLYSVQGEILVGRTGRLIAEVAQSDTDLEGRGNAARLEFVYGTPKLDARVYFGQTDVSFVNPHAGLSPGRREAGANLTYRIDPKTFLAAEFLYSKDRFTGGDRKGGLVTLQRALGYNLGAMVGVRHTRDTDAPPYFNSRGVGARDSTTVLGRMDWQPPILRGGSLFVEYEQDVKRSEARRAAVGGEYPVSDRGRVYFTHEFISSLTGVYGLTDRGQNNHNTVVGLDFDYMEEGQAFSEYRIRDAISGREAEAAIGLRNAWMLRPGLRLQTGFERVQPLDGDLNESTAIVGAVEYTANPLWKGSTRLEWRRSDVTTNVLNTLGVARKLSNDWTFLGKNTLDWREDRDTDDVYLRNRFRTGLAFRDTFTNRLDALMRYEFLFEKDDAARGRRQAHIWSAHANHRASKKLTVSGRYAGKYVEERGADFDSDYMAHLVSGRVMYDIDDEWDGGVVAGTLFDSGFDSRQYGLGVEVGHQLQQNLWISVGYNFFGYEDEDLSGEDSTNPGAYLRLRYKFDEEALAWLR